MICHMSLIQYGLVESIAFKNLVHHISVDVYCVVYLRILFNLASICQFFFILFELGFIVFSSNFKVGSFQILSIVIFLH